MSTTASTSSDTTATKLAALVAAHETEVTRAANTFVAFFEADLAAGSVTVDKLREHPTIVWMPPPPLNEAYYRACLHALAEKTGMLVSWSGCAKCPLTLRKGLAKCSRPAAPGGETVMHMLAGVAKAARGEAVSAKESESLTAMLTFLSSMTSGCYGMDVPAVSIGPDDSNLCSHAGGGTHIGHQRFPHMMHGPGTWLS